VGVADPHAERDSKSKNCSSLPILFCLRLDHQTYTVAGDINHSRNTERNNLYPHKYLARTHSFTHALQGVWRVFSGPLSGQLKIQGGIGSQDSILPDATLFFGPFSLVPCPCLADTSLSSPSLHNPPPCSTPQQDLPIVAFTRSQIHTNTHPSQCVALSDFHCSSRFSVGNTMELLSPSWSCRQLQYEVLTTIISRFSRSPADDYPH